MDREFDVIVYGATGYSGRLVAEYLIRAGGKTRWAMAGRSQQKLQEVRDLLGASASVPLIVADAHEPAALMALAESTRVVLTTAGPYQLYGDDLVAACAAAGTDYVDLTGESNWIAKMMAAHEATAKASGARLVFSCGFDSVPFDLGVYFVEEEAKKRFGAYAPRVRGRVRAMNGGLSGGTMASGQATAAAIQKDPSLMAMMADPFALTPGFKGPPQPPAGAPMHDPDLDADLDAGNPNRGPNACAHADPSHRDPHPGSHPHERANASCRPRSGWRHRVGRLQRPESQRLSGGPGDLRCPGQRLRWPDR